MSVQLVDCREVPIDRVTVFPDRAEIKRTVKVELEAGTTEVNIRHIPGNVLDDSVRVSGRGTAIIHEVQVAHKEVTEKEKACPQALELRSQIEEKEKENGLIENRRKVLQKKREALDALMMKLGGDDSKSLNFSETNFDGIGKLFEFYEGQALSLCGQEDQLKRDLQEANESLNVLRSEYNRYAHPGPVKTVTVVLESGTGGAVELDLSYQVFDAFWRPTYDIRVEKVTKEMQISYYGRVTQHSGEEWNGCQLALSTAKPAVGGTVPVLGTLDVLFYRPPEPQVLSRGGGMGVMGANASTASLFGSSVSNNSLASFTLAAPVPMSLSAFGAAGAPQMMMMRGAKVGMESQDMIAMAVSTAAVSEQALSTEFLIARPAAIPPDGAEHKVTIGVATLSPVLSYECVPSRNNSVYLTASAVNTSPLPFLAGEAAVFLDGNFISKSSLNAVSPNERFTVSLGVDAAIRVDYKPALKLKGESGMITKTASSVHEQKIVVKNTKKEDILITVKEHLPRSTDEKIRVKLLHPTATVSTHIEGEPRREGAIVNSSNNLEWTIHITPNENKELHVKWAVEYPPTEKIEYREKF